MLIETVLVEAGHVPLVIVHIKIVCPVVNPVTVALDELVGLIVPVPETSDHVPVPIEGLFAIRLVVKAAQIFWFVPASAVVGIALTFTETVLVDAGQVPLVIVHTKIFDPVLKLFTDELFEVGEVIVAPPDKTLHVPVPTKGLFAFNVAVETQRVCAVPAFAIVGMASTLIETVLVEAGQVPLVIVHLKIFVPTGKLVTEEE